MIRIFMLFALMGCVFSAFTQADTLSEKTLEEVVISANKFAERKKNINQKIEVITAKTIAAINAQNIGDLLSSTGNVFIQKSQQGGSSPVLRGFEASRVLLVIDGIRMNNAIYRAGHLQNVITVDQNMLERVEVLYGPASTLYGSDALGGVIHLRTKVPQLAWEKKILLKTVAFSRFSSVNNEKTIHANFNMGGKKISWLQSFTYSYFGDMKMGSNYPAKYPGFGRRDSLISTENGIDNMIANKDSRIQKFSSYKQWDITQKILFKPSDKFSHLLNIQMSNSTNVPRYDRLQDKRNFGDSIGTTLRFAEWYYGPQTRYLGSYELNFSTAGFFNLLRLNLNYQNIEESRQQREYRRYDQFDSRKEKISIAGFILDARKKWDNHELTAGADGQLNFLTSTASRTNRITGMVSPLDSRYPNGKNNMNYFGFFAQHLMKLNNGKLILNDGIRLQVVTLHSAIADNSFFLLPITEFEQNTFAVTGNLGLVFLPSEDFRITAGFSSGFRNPNIDDLARVFESSTELKRVVIPNADIKPEYTYNFDLGISKTIAEKIKFEITGFYTLFRNAIGLAPFQLNGQDSILYNGIRSAVFANRNVKNATTTGFNTNLKIDFNSRVSFFGTLTYTYGRFKNNNGSKTPQDHLPPLYGKASFSFNQNKFSSEGFIMFNGWKRIKNYNLDGEDNLQYATPDGMPSWLTLNWRNSFNLNKNIQLQFAIENIFDRNYRYFASGFSAPGRNFIMAIRASL
ncbi:MAG TPA: TonB-dependent receptor [Chitinophagaceae bacterium]|nr:TonB-dependent receptor [Chitinophagaceae bacterium]